MTPLLLRLRQLREAAGLTQGELADMVGTTRESVNKQLRAWEESGVLELKRNHVIVRDRTRLRAVAEMLDR